MAFTSGFHNSKQGDRIYNAEQFSSMFDRIVTDGVFENVQIGGSIDNNDKFYIESIGGMNIRIGRGKAWLKRTWNVHSTKRTTSISKAHGVFSRYDAVVIEVNKEDRINSIKIIEGKSAATAVKPELVQTDDIYQYPIAYIFIHYGVSAITQDDIEYMVGTSAFPYAKAITEDLDYLQYVVDNLRTTKAGYMLSANQGNVIDGLISDFDDNIENGKETVNAELDSVISTESEKLDTNYNVEDLLYDSSNGVILDSNNAQIIVVGKYIPDTFSDAKHFADANLDVMKNSTSSSVATKFNLVYNSLMANLDQTDIVSLINNKLTSLYSKLNSFVSKVDKLVSTVTNHYEIEIEIDSIGLDKDAGEATKHLPLQPINTFSSNALNSMGSSVSTYTTTNNRLNGLSFGYDEKAGRYGYYKSNGEFVYFKSGRIYDLGSTDLGTVFDLSSYANYKSYTSSNFLYTVEGYSLSVNADIVTSQDGKVDREAPESYYNPDTQVNHYFWVTGSSKSEISASANNNTSSPVLTYSASTGKLTVSNLSSQASASDVLSVRLYTKIVHERVGTSVNDIFIDDGYPEEETDSKKGNITFICTLKLHIYLID